LDPRYFDAGELYLIVNCCAAAISLMTSSSAVVQTVPSLCAHLNVPSDAAKAKSFTGSKTSCLLLPANTASDNACTCFAEQPLPSAFLHLIAVEGGADFGCGGACAIISRAGTSESIADMLFSISHACSEPRA